MENQCTASFDHIIQEKFCKSEKELLVQYAKNNVIYNRVLRRQALTLVL